MNPTWISTPLGGLVSFALARKALKKTDPNYDVKVAGITAAGTGLGYGVGKAIEGANHQEADKFHASEPLPTDKQKAKSMLASTILQQLKGGDLRDMDSKKPEDVAARQLLETSRGKPYGSSREAQIDFNNMVSSVGTPLKGKLSPEDQKTLQGQLDQAADQPSAIGWLGHRVMNRLKEHLSGNKDAAQ